HAWPVLGIQLVEVDGEALRQIPPTVNRIERAAMWAVTATAEGDPPWPGQRRAEHHRRPPIDCHRGSGVGEAACGYGHVGRGINLQPVRDGSRDVVRTGERHVEPDDADRG